MAGEWLDDAAAVGGARVDGAGRRSLRVRGRASELQG